MKKIFFILFFLLELLFQFFSEGIIHTQDAYIFKLPSGYYMRFGNDEEAKNETFEELMARTFLLDNLAAAGFISEDVIAKVEYQYELYVAKTGKSLQHYRLIYKGDEFMGLTIVNEDE